MRRCLACGRAITLQQSRQSLARMIEAGMTVAEAKARSPSCFACARQVQVLPRVSASDEEMKHETRLSDTHR
jgi:hypothetical protein